MMYGCVSYVPVGVCQSTISFIEVDVASVTDKVMHSQSAVATQSYVDLPQEVREGEGHS